MVQNQERNSVFWPATNFSFFALGGIIDNSTRAVSVRRIAQQAARVKGAWHKYATARRAQDGGRGHELLLVPFGL